MSEITIHHFFKPIHVTQASVPYGLQSWLETILLVDDKEASRLNDWTVGYYHCKHCGAFQGFAYKLDDNGPSAKAHNEQLDFMLAHAHGDGRIALFEKKLPQPPAGEGKELDE